MWLNERVEGINPNCIDRVNDKGQNYIICPQAKYISKKATPICICMKERTNEQTSRPK